MRAHLIHSKMTCRHSAVLVAHRDKKNIRESLVDELNRKRTRLSENRYPLHCGKTECILFGSEFRQRKDSDPDTEIGGISVASKSAVNYLGRIPDNNLGGDAMALKLLSKEGLKLLYYTIITILPDAVSS